VVAGRLKLVRDGTAGGTLKNAWFVVSACD
jgi:hypothetical protein